MSKTTVRPMIEVALLATIAYILDLVTQPMSLGPWISLSFKMVPIFLLSFRWGVKAGAMGGFIWGLLQVVTGEAAGGWLTPIQGFLEYFVAFSLIGLSGTVKPALDKAIRDKKRVQTLTYITESSWVVLHATSFTTLQGSSSGEAMLQLAKVPTFILLL